MRAQILEDGQSSESNPEEGRPTPTQLAARMVLVQRATILAMVMGLVCGAFFLGRVSVSSEASSESSMPLVEQHLKVIGSDPPIIKSYDGDDRVLQSSSPICIDSGALKGLCLNNVPYNTDMLDFQPRRTATRWQTGGSDIWLQSGKSGKSLGPRSTPVSAATPAALGGDNFEIDWGFDGDTIELKGNRRRRRAGNTGLCLAIGGNTAGSEAMWNPCDEDSLTFSS